MNKNETIQNILMDLSETIGTLERQTIGAKLQFIIEAFCFVGDCPVNSTNGKPVTRVKQDYADHFAQAIQHLANDLEKGAKP
jgi:hypothetical protein